MNKLFWKIGIDSFKKLYKEKINKLKEVSLIMTREVIRERETMKNAIIHLRIQIQKLLELEISFERLIAKISELGAEMDQSKSYKIQTERFRIIKEPLQAGTYVTNCVNCNSTCHYPCSISDDQNKAGCAAMNNSGYCSVCASKCYWNVHKNMQFRFNTEKYTKEVELGEIKKKYINSKSLKSAKEQVLDGLIKECGDCNLQSMQKQLNEIALLPAVSDSQEKYVQIMIEEEQRKQDEGWESRVKVLQETKQDWQIIRELQQDDGTVKLTKEFYQKKILPKKQEYQNKGKNFRSDWF